MDTNLNDKLNEIPVSIDQWIKDLNNGNGLFRTELTIQDFLNQLGELLLEKVLQGAEEPITEDKVVVKKKCTNSKQPTS